MNIIILGAGKVGSYLTEDLADEGYDILVIDRDKEVLDKLLASNDVMGIVGDGRDPEVLLDANVGSCDLFIAITLSDDVNLIASTIAKKLGAKNIIIRLREAKYINQREIIEDITSASRIINPEMIAAKDIQRALKYSHALNVEGFFDDQAIMMELVISKDSVLAGAKIMDLNAYSYDYHTLIGIVNNKGKVVIPHGSYVLEEGEKIYIIGAKEGVDRFYKKEVVDRIEIRNVLIIGAGAISTHLTELLLDRGFEVTVVDIDRKRAELISEKFSDAIVINADGSDPDVLEEVRVESFDAMVCLTGMDEENILISLLGEKYGIEKIIAKVNRTKLLKMTGILDIDTTFTPKRVASDVINRIIRSKENARGQSITSLYRLEDDQVEVIEFAAIEHSDILNKKLKDLKIREDTLIACIKHEELDGRMEVASGESMISLGDRVLVITTNHSFQTIDDIVEQA
ncbi:Trk system potassium transporter TrkA [uncultured Anaerococcus sp.]|uniref:Trk system potassium transporter TrkA n=2 Tax=uncultured Anaerococcus sp. TaxID=293428 RepID=UPI00260C2293|nr:Trk system potassium transporter TrkA [uncultured Anaerococcus sp.]